jgi:hypothetical protein
VHVSGTERANHFPSVSHPDRENDEHRTPAVVVTDCDVAVFLLGVFVVRNEERIVVEHMLDLSDRHAVRLVFFQIAGIPHIVRYEGHN